MRVKNEQFTVCDTLSLIALCFGSVIFRPLSSGLRFIRLPPYGYLSNASVRYLYVRRREMLVKEKRW